MGDAQYKIGIVGATGAVGIEVVTCLHKLEFPVSDLVLFASSRSAGKVVNTPFGDVTIIEYSLESARLCDIVFLAVSGSFALENARKIVEGDGPIVIDNSSAFRYMDDIPLVIPEINGHKIKDGKLIANPNCTTAIAAVALWPLHCEYGIKKCILLSTDKAVSPVNAMGLTKAVMERVMLSKARTSQANGTIFSATRYGNVVGSRGSVIPLFLKLSIVFK